MKAAQDTSYMRIRQAVIVEAVGCATLQTFLSSQRAQRAARKHLVSVQGSSVKRLLIIGSKDFPKLQFASGPNVSR